MPRPNQRRNRKETVESFTFIDFESSTSPAIVSKQRRKEVRKLAALASADTRRATLSERALAKQNVRKYETPMHWHSLEARAKVLSQRFIDRRVYSPDEVDDSLRTLVDFVTHISSQENAWTGSIERAFLAHKAVRTILWSGIVNSATLFQAAIFVSSTHSNTCGLPSDTFHHGVGLLLLRGASLGAVQAAVIAEPDNLTPVAIAMLAGWERKYGDRESYEAHMLAWRSLQLPDGALQEDHVVKLTEMTFEAFREGLCERAYALASKESPQLRDDLALPVGLRLFQEERVEVRTLLDISRRFTALDPASADSVAEGRRIGIENIAWSPYHTVSVLPAPAVEQACDPMQLNALYHLRACQISISAVQLAASCVQHDVVWPWDWRAGIQVHTVSCQHLRTRELLNTRFAELAIWSRFTMCAISRDPDRDEEIGSFLRALDIDTWDDLQALLRRHIYLEPLYGESCWAFWQLLTRGVLNDQASSSIT